MSQQSRLSGALSLMIAQAVVLVLGYVTHLWIGRVLGPGPYGIYGVILSVQGIIGLILTLGVPVAVARFVAQNPESAQSILQRAIKLQIGIAVVIGIATLALSSLMAHFLGDAGLANYLRFTALIIVLQAFYPLYVQFFSGMHAFHRQAVLTALYAVAKLAGAMTLIYTFHVYGAFAGFAIGGLVAWLVGWWWTRNKGGNEPTVLPIKSFLQFAGVYVAILVGLQILISLDLFMVKAILKDDVLAGYYNAAVTLSRISYFLLQALAFILLPSVSALTTPGRSHDEAARFIKEAIRYMIALIVPSVALASATSKALVTLFYSNKYSAAAPVLTVLMVGVGSLAFYLLLMNIMAGAGRAKAGFYMTITMIFISAGLGAWLIPHYGLQGAAWQTTITGLLGLTVASIYTFKSFSIPMPVRCTLNVVIASTLAIIPTYFWHPKSAMVLIQYVVVLVLYIGFLWMLGEVTEQDRAYVASLHPILKILA